MMRTYVNCGFVKSNTDGVKVINTPLCKNALPRTYNLNKNLRTVIDQGSRGICASASTTDAVEYLLRSMNKKTSLSPSMFYDKRANKRIDGMTIIEAIELAKKQYPIRDYALVNNPLIMKQCIVANGPVIIALPVGNFGTEFWKDGLKYGGHAVVITGWDEHGFILKNSWGFDYGNGGYSTFPEEDYHFLLEAWTLFS